MKKNLLLCYIFLLLTGSLLTGCQSKAPAHLDTSENIVLTIASPWTDVRALENIAQKFQHKYPNCTIEYEYVQDYYDALSKRLPSENNKLDLFFSTNIQADSVVLPYALELFSQEHLDLSDTYEGLITNFTYMNSDHSAASQIYAIPTGGELRGMFVNTTLLSSLNLTVPANRQELLDACKVLSENGYVPLQGNPGSFSQQLLYPYVCNLIVNGSDYEANYNRINQSEAGISALFEEPMSVMYTLMEQKYYNYKYVETELNMFNDASNEGISRDFLNIRANAAGEYEKIDDLGQVAFMPASMTIDGVLTKTKEDYHSNIEYEFILSPVSEDGGYAYMSPAQGLAINKNSDHIDWAVEFMNFFYDEKNNKTFAEDFGIIPNTNDALKYIKRKFDIKDNQISQLGQMTFDYGFYGIINKSLVEISKGNNPKYMQDENTLYDLSYYMNRLETRFEEQRTGSDILEDD